MCIYIYIYIHIERERYVFVLTSYEGRRVDVKMDAGIDLLTASEGGMLRSWIPVP